MNQPTTHEPSQGAKYSLYYITAGALVVIWSGIWFYYLSNSEVPRGDSRWYVCTGLLLSGLAVLVIGMLVGRIGQEGKHADVPVAEVPAAQVPANGAVVDGPPTAPAPVQTPNRATVPRI
jgi:hypothetical protein